MKQENKQFSFEISLSVLNHLGRNLYRSFATVLGEAISNAWDADAENVWIYTNKKNNSFLIKDDGIGMDSHDFQNKFLKIGYSKRNERTTSLIRRRPYIGRKGIGKLALLSCADKITVISKIKGGDYVGGIIDNSDLDKAITKDLTPQQYKLGKLRLDNFAKYTKGHKHGAIIYFKNIKDRVKHSLDFLKKIVALYFRFSLLDKSFNIFIDGEKITYKHLNDLAQKTEFLWEINSLDDPYVKNLKKMFTSEHNEQKHLNIGGGIEGFIASVEKPLNLNIITTEGKVGVDLFVNGRMRERDILRHIPTARVAENYLYGQIHFNKLDKGDDRFTSNRESIVDDDSEYKNFLNDLKSKVIKRILEDWDIWRLKHKKDGDTENERISQKERKSRALYNVVSEEFALPKGSANEGKVGAWVDDLSEDAQHNFVSYADCFTSENLIRKYIQAEKITLTPEAEKNIEDLKTRETNSKTEGNINIDLRQAAINISYLDMFGLATLVDKKNSKNCLHNDAKQYKPIRDALMHTALLTDEAKRKLKTVYENIKGRVKTLLSNNKNPK